MFRRTLVALLLAAVPMERTGFAQAAPPAATVTPPRLIHDDGVTYPAAALAAGYHEALTIELIVEIDADGAVTNATVTAPHERGFDEAALASARTLVFEPARNGGAAIPSKIKFSYVFTPPAPKLTGKVLRQGSDTPVEGATITVRDHAGSDATTVSGPDGGFVFDQLAPGAAHVVVSGAELAPLASDELLAPGEETALVLRVSPAHPVAAPIAQAQPGETVVEVTVRGVRPPREVTKRTLSRDEIAHVPGTNGDALKAIQAMPGVARPPLLSTGLVVRGSAPQDTGVFLDGTGIPIIYHFGGLSSVVPTEVLDKIDFFPGNFSSEYGRGMGGIIDVGLRDPRTDRLHAIAQADLIDTRLLVEGPLGRGWSFLAAGRRSWFDVWLKPILSGSSLGLTTAPVYSDYQVMVTKEITKRESLRFLVFGSDDVLRLLNRNPDASDSSMGGDLNAHTSFWRAQARYKKDFGDASLKLTLAYGSDLTSLGSGARFREMTARPLSLRAEATEKLAPGVTANLGLDLVYESYDLHSRTAPQRQPGQPDLGTTDTPIDVSASGHLVLPGIYTEWELTPTRGFRIVPGIRIDYNDSTKSWDIQPRLSARQDLTTGFPRTTLKEGIGVFDQPPTPFQTDPLIGQLGLHSNHSVHYDLGLEQELTHQVDLSVDGFVKTLDNLVVPSALNDGRGTIYGVETLLRYNPDERFFGWLSYTLSRSERKDTATSPVRVDRYDQTHVLTVLGGYKLGRGWQLGARFRLVSGPLDTSSSYGAFDATAGAQLSVDQYPPFATRLPLFTQIDLRADKTWTFRHWKLTGYLDIQNALNNQSDESLSYNYNFTRSTYAHGLPILPSLGLRAEY